MKNTFTISIFILKFIICSGISDSAPAAKSPAYLQHILNPSESLTGISFEDEQEVETIFGEVINAAEDRNIFRQRRTYAEHKRMSEIPKVGANLSDVNIDHGAKSYNVEKVVPFERESYSSIDTNAIVERKMRKDKRKREDDFTDTESADDISTKSPLEIACNPQNVSDFIDDDSDPVKRFRIPKDEKKKIEELLKEGKSVNQIIGIQDQSIRDGVWKRRVSKRTLFRMSRKYKEQLY
ncbi:hypothetical protein O9G_000667 [Rozella allomycis CSF55]|uniref:Uncharacterized protein n=1 Tax=Rozella allomycis (strain CSF55) TaxID=988480 RepID=A0A075B2S2_ROZAC|nr:hypothetical protein O9G_000667 [Rozella allomycis CSF55]|eukprot:EPZ35271.1 hypothetical protein O9G_000667 [Rozella allomycis CSF55]